MSDENPLLARLFLGAPFIVRGFLKLGGGDARRCRRCAAWGLLPDATALACRVGFCELAGGVMVVPGYPARTAGALPGLWCLVTAYIGHKGDTNQMLAHTCMAGGLFTLASIGAGTLALFGGHPEGVFALLP